MTIPLVAQRHAQLRHRLRPDEAHQPADLPWIRARVRTYAAAAGVQVDLILDATEYQRRTGVHVHPLLAGDAYRGPRHARRTPPLLFLNPALLDSRGSAELVIAHEMMHLGWWSYGHRPIAFRRAQQLIERVAKVDPHELNA